MNIILKGIAAQHYSALLQAHPMHSQQSVLEDAIALHAKLQQVPDDLINGLESHNRFNSIIQKYHQIKEGIHSVKELELSRQETTLLERTYGWQPRYWAAKITPAIDSLYEVLQLKSNRNSSHYG